jgi:hypothetical protein
MPASVRVGGSMTRGTPEEPRVWPFLSLEDDALRQPHRFFLSNQFPNTTLRTNPNLGCVRLRSQR